MAKVIKTVKKIQKGKEEPKYVSPYKSERTTDSTQYFRDKVSDIAEADYNIGTRSQSSNKSRVQENNSKEMMKAMNDLSRQGLKGKKGFDKNGFPITYKQAQAASKKRTGGKVVAKKAKSGAKVMKKSSSKKK